jgi:hypothetical protein
MVLVDTASLMVCTIGSMVAPNLATLSLVVVLVETEVPAVEGTEDDVAPSAVDRATLLSLAAG